MAHVIVGMCSSYPGLTQSDWLWKQTPEPFGQYKNIQMLAQAEKPEFLLMYNFDFPRATAKPKPIKTRFKDSILNILDVRVKPQSQKPQEIISESLRGISRENIFFLTREPPLEEVIQQQIDNYQAAEKYCGYISGPSQFAPMPDYMPAIWYVNVSYDQLEQGDIPFKSFPCSWITSGINRTENHRKRLNFLRMVKELELQVDIYGRNLPTWSNSQGTLENKWHGMAPYYYNLAIENYAENDLYVSEKMWDALLSWCLPIYYGGGAADKLLPPGSFLRLPSLDEKGIEYIKEVTSNPDAWHDAQSAIAEARQIILHKLNLMNWLYERVEKQANISL